MVFISSFYFVLKKQFIATLILFSRAEIKQMCNMAEERKDRKSEIEKIIKVVKPIILKGLFKKLPSG